MVDVAICYYASVCVYHLFAAASKSVIEIFLNEYSVATVADSYKSILIVPGVGELTVICQVSVEVILINSVKSADIEGRAVTRKLSSTLIAIYTSVMRLVILDLS